VILFRSLVLAVALVTPTSPSAVPEVPERAGVQATREQPPAVAEGQLDWSEGVQVDPDVRLTGDWGEALPTGVF